jgi:raffinose/stachyose/melibiose transport system substrate-binding protein
MRKILTLILAMSLLLAVSVSVLAETELTLWHSFTTNDCMDVICADYMALNPDIKINVVSMEAQDINRAIKMALTSGSGPDIVYLDCGPGYMGVMANSGLILSLDDAAATYGWADKLAGWGLEAAKYNGKLYGIASEYEILCCYYNKAIFEQIGATVPTTYDEFVEICKKAKEAGITGLVLDDLDQWPGFHYESLFMGAFGGPEMIQAVMDKTIDGGFNQPEFAAGLDALRALVSEGYTTEFPNAVSHDDALRDFYSGGGAMYLTGTWACDGMYTNMGDNVGMFIFPAARDDIPSVPPVGVGSGMQVSAATQYPEECFKLLDYMFDGETGAKTWMERSATITPATVDTTDMDINPLFAQLLDIAENTDVFNKNLDVLMPQNVNDAAKNYMQQVIDGVITGQQAVEIKQAELEKAIQEGNF